MKRIVRVFLLLSLILSPILAKATISVGFTGGPSLSGCDSLFAYFSPTVTGCSGGVSYTWVYIDPTGVRHTSSISNYTFNMIGNWDVVCYAACGGDLDSSVHTSYIHVLRSPTIDFTTTSPAADTNLSCAHTVNFINTSNADTSCAGYTWTWIITGPTGTTAHTRDLSYYFSAPGNYTVTLLYFAPACGCFGNVVKTNYIKIQAKPDACFTQSDSIICHPGGSITDSALCTIGATSYEWHFGDGATVTGSSPVVSHTYTASGFYNETLIVSSSAGCADTAYRYHGVFVGSLNVAMAISTADTVCEGTTVTFTGTASGVIGTETHVYTLYSGSSVVDSYTGSPGSFTFNYASYPAGAFYVTDVVTDGQGCTATTSRNIFVRVNPVIDSFTADTLYKCTPNIVEHFHAHVTPSSGITYAWAFASAASATFTGTGTTGANPTYTYTASSTFSPKLIVTDSHGCTDTLTRTNYIFIGNARLSMTKDLDSGCVGMTVHFRVDATPAAASTSFVVDTVDFGDGTARCYGASCADSSHTYTTAGIHYIYVSAHLPAYLGGCRFTLIDSVKVGASHPDFHLTISPNDSICPNNIVAFAANCTNCTWYDWEFHTPSGALYTAIGPAPTNDTTSVYYTSVTGTPPGNYPFSLVMSFNGCTDTLNDTITVFGPRRGQLFARHDCRRTDSFTLTLSGATGDSINYWYSDGTLIATTTGTAATGLNTLNRIFTPGYHTIKVLEHGPARLGGCPLMSDTLLIFVGRDSLRWHMDSVLCVGETAHLWGPHQADGTNYDSYEWTFGDGGTGTTTDSNQTHTYTTAGTFPAFVIVTNSSGCRDTTRRINVVVIGPHGGMTVNNDTLCVGDAFIFTDHNVTTSPYVITHRWYESPSTTPILAGTGSTYATLTRSWPTRGVHTIILNDTDNSPHRCGISQSLTVVTVKPYAYFTSNDSDMLVCPFLPICFHDTNTHCTYSWNFGDAPGWSTPSATAQDTCHSYTYNSAFTVKCAIYSDGTGGYPAGCSDTFIRTAYINTGSMVVTSSNFGDGDTVSCPPLRVVRYADTPGRSHTWHVRQLPIGSGPISTFTGALLNTSLLGTGSYLVTLIDSTPRGCFDSVSYTYFIGGPTGYISLSDTSGCAPDSIRFHFTNTGVPVTSNYIWTMCPYGTFSTTGDTTFIFPTAGVYCAPTLTIQSGTCVVNINNLTDSIRIYPVPTVTITGTGILCYGGSATLIASGADSYVWTPSTFLTSDTVAAPSVSPTVTTTYMVRGTTIYGCWDTAVTTVMVDPPIHLRISGRDSMCIGFCDTLIATGLPGASYVWRGVGTSCAVCDTNIVCITSTKTYTVSATDGAGCSDSTTFKVTVNPAPILHYTPATPFVCNDGGDGQVISMTGAASYIWKPRIGLSCDSCASPTCKATSNIIYSVTGTTQYGCIDSIIIPVVVYDSVPTAIFKDTSICRGDVAHLLAKGGVSYLWFPNDGTIDDRTSYRPTVHPSYNTKYSVIITENVCFKDTLSVDVRVVQLPILMVPPGATIIAGSTYQLYANYGDSANHSYLTHFEWTPADSTLTCFDCPRPIATPTNTTTYSVTASTIEGCAGSATVTIKILCEGSQVFIPNTFTPNGDGVNDRFYVSGRGLGAVTKMAIYNRWGELVYEGTGARANDPAFGWDGTYKGEVLAPDVFVYVIEVQCTTGEPFTFRGDISLIR